MKTTVPLGHWKKSKFNKKINKKLMLSSNLKNGLPSVQLNYMWKIILKISLGIPVLETNVLN